MNLDQYKYIYFLGIGGIGMSALARYCNSYGKDVSGYDKRCSSLTKELEAEGISIHYEDNISYISEDIKSSGPDEVLVIYTPAIENNSEFSFFESKGITPLKRAQFLGMITKESYTIAISGTHGKTTTSVLLTHILKNSGIPCSAFLGGISKNYNTNSCFSRESNIIVVEADEYDRSFLTLYPDILIITSIDADHLDIYKNKESIVETFSQFASQVNPEGLILMQKDINIDIEKPELGELLFYASNLETDCFSNNILIDYRETTFDLNLSKQLSGDISRKNKINLGLSLPGNHNIENLIAASAVAFFLGVNVEKIRDSLMSFNGIKRRFEIQIQNTTTIYIDDYAHHPKEIKVTIDAVRKLYEGKKLTVIFQPHLYSRTQDFVDEFADSLSLADELILLEIYAARENPIDGVTSRMLAEKCSIQNQVCSKGELLNLLKKKDVELLLTLGAGDISAMVEPIKTLYN